LQDDMKTIIFFLRFFFKKVKRSWNFFAGSITT
jgi:hypothetical protein